MPYVRVGKCVHKKNSDGSAGDVVPGGCHDTPEEAEKHMRALYANVKDSAIQEMSLAIVKASYETNEPNPDRRMRFRMSSSDIGKDLAEESMSMELFKSFVDRIKSETPIPEEFKSVVCENDWCGGIPYLSVAHYKAGKEKHNVPGTIEEVFIDGNVLKSKGYCNNSPLGREVWNSLLDDQHKRKSGVKDFDPIRVSIGFLDLKHKHQLQDGGGEFIFERKSLTDYCPLCEKGIGGKIYLDGILVHEAMTRVPMNPRTIMVAEDGMTQKSEADDIKTKRDDARSIVGSLADTLEDDGMENKSMLVIKSDDVTQGSENVPDPSEFDECFNPNTGGYNQDCIDARVSSQMAREREGMAAVKSQTVDKELLDGVTRAIVKVYKSNGLEMPVEAIMESKVVVEKTKDEDVDDKETKEVEKPDKVEKTKLDVAQETLKSVLASGKATREEVQEAFNAVAAAVEESYTPPAPDMSNLAEIVKSAVESAVTPLQIKIAALEAAVGSGRAPKKEVPQSRALRLTPEILTKSAQKPVQELSQIQKIARASVGLPVEE